jgi:hypothetical protein
LLRLNIFLFIILKGAPEKCIPGFVFVQNGPGLIRIGQDKAQQKEFKQTDPVPFTFLLMKILLAMLKPFEIPQNMYI